MKQITVPGKEQLSMLSQSILDTVKRKIGSVPGLYATIAYSAPALKAMLDFEADIIADAAFSAKEREAINLIVSQVNHCEYCLAAHTVLAKMHGYSEDETYAIRRAAYPQAPKLNAAIRLARSIAANKGEPEANLLEIFFEEGYNEKALIELIGLISIRTFTNYVFAATRIPIDFPEARPLQESAA